MFPPFKHCFITHRFLCAVGLISLLSAAQSHAIKLEQSIDRVLQQSPALRSAQAGVEASEHQSKQDAKLPNPTLVFDAENIAGTDIYEGTDAAEYTLTVEQRIELGGKRSVRRDLAQIDLKEATFTEQRVTEQLTAETRRRFFQLVIAQQREALAEQRLQAAAQAAEAVQTREQVGAATLLDLHRTDIAVSLAQILYEEARQHRELARQRLASLWGAEVPTFERAEATLDVPESLPDKTTLLRALQSSLSWKLSETDLDRKQLQIALQRSSAHPDVTFSAGRRWLRVDAAQAWNVGVAVDLPLFNRNRDGIRAATATSRQSHFQVAANRQYLLETLSQAHASLAAAWSTIRALEATTLPKARATYALVSEGYELGRHELLYLLEVQQTLFEIESTQIDSFESFLDASTDLYEILAESTPDSLKR